MQEQLISFETAKLAKEKGFNIPVIYVFDDIDGTLTASYVKNVFDLLKYNTSIHKCSRPAQSLLQKWLRDKHCIHVEVIWVDTLSDIYVYHISTTNNAIRPDSIFYHSYEEALEQGLLEALKLI